MSFGDAGGEACRGEIVADVEQALPLVGVDSKEWAATLTVTWTCWKSLRLCTIR